MSDCRTCTHYAQKLAYCGGPREDLTNAYGIWHPLKKLPADHPLLDTGPIVDLIATYGPAAARPVAEAGLYAGLMTNGWLMALAYPDGYEEPS